MARKESEENAQDDEAEAFPEASLSTAVCTPPLVEWRSICHSSSQKVQQTTSAILPLS